MKANFRPNTYLSVLWNSKLSFYNMHKNLAAPTSYTATTTATATTTTATTTTTTTTTTSTTTTGINILKLFSQAIALNWQLQFEMIVVV